MPTPATADDLLKLIRKSGIVDESRLDAYLEKLRGSGSLPTDVRKLAGAMVRDGLLTFFQAEQFMLGKWRGFTIGKYKLLERIGFGGMGQVFLCEHLYMRRRVAIKVLPPAKAEEPAALGRFYREARTAAALDHPNIVRTHDIDQDGNLHFLVMEYVDGTSLLEIVKRKGPMEISRACHYIWQAAQGLDHAHRVGIVHRDIKPGNILIDRYGTAKILDMGLARFYHSDDDNLTKKYDEKSVLGTADYVAPEQTMDSHQVDIRADLYSLGATFYYLLAGHPPFPEGTVSQKLIAHQTKKPTPVHELRPEVPLQLSQVIDRLLAKAPDDRFQTASELCDALVPFVQDDVATPPEDEMPVLSMAAREILAATPTGGGLSGNLRQDSAIARAEIPQRSGRLAVASPGAPRSTAPAPSLTGSATLPPRPGDSYSGSATPVVFETPPTPKSGFGSSVMSGSVTAPASQVETARMAEATDRTDRQRPAAATVPTAQPARSPRWLAPVIRIILESTLVIGLCLIVLLVVLRKF